LTREATIKLIGIITMAYPNFDKFRDEKHIRSMVGVWADMFSDDEEALVALAVKEHISTSKWPPSIAEIREIMTRIANPDIIPVDEAWEIVSKFLYVTGEHCYGDYHRTLPKAIAETIDAIGYGQLYALHVAYARGNASKAGLDRVAFVQAYEGKIERQRKQAMLPESLQKKMAAVSASFETGQRALADGINRQYQEKKDYYERSWQRDLLAIEAGAAEYKRLEESHQRALEARYERGDEYAED